MAARATPRYEIDRKLQTICLEADPSQFRSAMALARQVERLSDQAFSYQRLGATLHANALTIAAYVLYSRDIGLLDPNFAPTRVKTDFRTITNFQHWLNDTAIRYLSTNGASISQIASAIDTLLSRRPAQLPTIGNLHSQLNMGISIRNLRLSLRVLALLRPRAIRLVSRRLILLPSVITT